MTRPLHWWRLLGVGTAVVLTVLAGFAAPAAAAGSTSTGVVLQIDVAGGYSINDVTTRFAIVVDRVLVARAGIYRAHPTRSMTTSQLSWLAADLQNSKPVTYAVPDNSLALEDTRFHSWPQGDDQDLGSSATPYLAQTVAAPLARANAISRGAGVRVAVLDTGISANHPALRGKMGPGYDYVDDDADPSERRTGLDSNGDGRVDASYGHGTFVAGMVSLVAPDATILPMRVLDSDGLGQELVIAQAIRDAVAARANVINLSFGTNADDHSDAIDSALSYAEKAGVLVVISAGNTGKMSPLYPADSGDALAVTAVVPGSNQIASYASRGFWVELAAPASGVVGPVPDGRYARWSGTSMAAPLVSGQAALIQSAAPRLTLDQRVKAITSTARWIGSFNARYGVQDIVASLQKAKS